MEKCQSNSDRQDISTKQRYDIHVPNTNLSNKKVFIPQELTYSITSHQPLLSSNHITNIFMPARK